MKEAIILLTALMSGLLQAETSPYHPKLIPAGYSVETISTPLDATGTPLAFGVGGIDFAENGDVFIASRLHGIWKYRNDSWLRFSDHLHDPQGIHVVDNNSVVVAQKPELTRITDTDGDGEGDLYQTICDSWRYAANYCEYVHGPVVDSKGNYYINLNLAHGDSNSFLKKEGSYMGTAGGYDGWNCQITPEGKLIPFASGLRSPAGIGINEKTDEIFYTENQGSWVGSSFLAHVQKGTFYGYPASLIDDPEFRGDPDKITFEAFSKMRKAPAVWLPHGDLSNSPGDPVFNYTEGKFGPFEGQIFIGCQTRSNILRVNLEKIQGEYQGAAFNFVDHLQSGCVRIAFDTMGRLWVGQTGRGWGSKGGQIYGLQRIKWDGKTIPFEMKAINLTENGFRISFTSPVNKDSLTSGSLAVNSWHYHYHKKYGSPKVDQQKHEAELVSISSDGLEATIRTALTTGKIFSIGLEGVTGSSGAPLSTKVGYYTLNRTLSKPGQR